MRIFVLTCAVVSFVSAQQPVPDTLSGLHEMLENLSEVDPSDEVIPDQAEEFLDLHENPIDLNRAGFRELQRIPAITPLLAYRIIAFRRQTHFESAAELLTIEGVSSDVYDRIVPFVIVKPRPGKSTFLSLRSRIRKNLQQRKGIQNSAYAGSGENILYRIHGRTYLSETVSVEGFALAQKDAGEPMDNGLFSGYLLAEAPSWKAIVGDLHIETGQKILLGRRNPVVSAPHEPVRRAAHSAIFGYRSSDEIGLLRGAALEVRLFRTVTLATFYSNKAVHGTVLDDGQFSPVSGAGLFRTAAELAKRKRSRERVLGTVVSVGSERWLVSAAAYYTRYLHRVLPKGRDSDEGTREFAGVSLSGWLALSNATMSAEFACQKNRATGFSAGIVIEPADVCCVGVSGTMFSSGYDRMLAGRRTPEQEFGLYGTAELRPAKNWKLQGESSFTEYADRWPGEVVRRSHVESSIALSRRTQVTFRCSVRESPGKAQTMTEDGLVRLIQSSQKRRHIVMSFVTGKGSPLQWTARMDYVVFRYPSGSRTSGLGVSQHCRWIASPGLSVEGKITLFGTDSYEERFFSFEPDVPGTFSSRQVFGRGSRSALLVRFRPFTVLELSCSYAVEIKDGARVLGSGMDQISGDTHGVVTIQIDAKL